MGRTADRLLNNTNTTSPTTGGRTSARLFAAQAARSQPPADDLEHFGENFSKGFLKGVGSTLKGIDTVARKVPLLGSFLNKVAPPSEKRTETMSRLVKPQNTSQKIGFGAEQAAEFLIPVGAEAKAVGFLKKLVPKAGAIAKVGARAAGSAAEFAGKTAVQTGGDKRETGIAAVVGALTPPVVSGAGAIIKKAAPKVGDVAASVVAQMIGKEPEHVKIAFKNADQVAKAMAEKRIPLEVREKAVSALKSFRYDERRGFGPAFDRTLAELKKLYPYRKTGRYKILVSREVNDATKGLPAILRKFRVGVTKNGAVLDFDKLNSAIVSPAERKNLQMVWDTVRNQKDFSVQGVQDAAARINALRKFEEGAATRESAIGGAIHDAYDTAIAKVYPELGKLRSTYKANMDVYEGIDEVLKSVANDVSDPIKVTTSVRKLSNLFNEDNEPYLRAIQRLEDASGTDLLKDLVASEFRNLTPGRFGSVLAQAGIATAGAFTNPLILAVLPLFSPRVQGKIITTLGKAAPKASATVPEAATAAPKVVLPFLRQNQ